MKRVHALAALLLAPTLLPLSAAPPGHGPPLMRAEADRAYARAQADGARMWRTRAQPLSRNGESCAGCHAPDGRPLAGVHARYPKLEPRLGRVVPLEERVALCITERMRGTPPRSGSPGSVALLVHLKELR